MSFRYALHHPSPSDLGRDLHAVSYFSEQAKLTEDSGLVNSTLSSHSTPLETAANYYQTAADTQSSAMAYWNLGWMYEMGKGVPRDWHLAKRYYDLSGDSALEAWPAVMLSLVGLYIRS